MNNLVNQTLKRYKLTALLGSGGMGAVYKGLDISLNREVAVKIMHPQYAQDSNFRQRFLQEARVAANLDHPGVVKVYDFDESQGVLFIVMEFISGMNLSQWLDDQRSAGCWISLGDAVELVRQITLALQHAHECGVLHRDIKPANIMIKNQPADRLEYRPVITDLGLAKLAEGVQITRQGESMGTPAYMSPEQAMGENVDGRSDVYSLGVLLYQLTVGQLPFASRTISEAIRDHTTKPPPLPSTIHPSFPPELERLILKALQKEPEHRFQSAVAFAKALDVFLRELSEIAKHSTLIQDASPQDLGTILVSQDELGRNESILAAFDRTPTGAGESFIQVHTPRQPDRIYPLVPGILRIGRGQDNDIVLDDSSVSRVHAQVSFDGITCKVIDQNSSNGTYLAANRLLAGIAEDWTPESPLQIGRFWLRLKFSTPSLPKENQASAFQPVSVSHSGTIGADLDPAQLTVDPGQPSRLAVTLKNQGYTVDHYRLTVDGVPESWVNDLPPPIQLMPDEMKTVYLTFQPPRNPKSRAGRYAGSVRIAGQMSQVDYVEQKFTLTVSPYSQFAAELHPQKVRAGAVTQVQIENQGNLPETYEMVFEDRGAEVRFETSKSKITIPEGQHASLKVLPRMRKMKWFGGEVSHPFTAKVSTTAGNSQTQTGEVVARGLIPVWVIPVVLVLCVLLAGSSMIVWPIIFSTPTPTIGPTKTPTPEPGMPILEEWCVYPEEDGPQFFADCPVQVKVVSGQKLIIRWRASNAEKITITPLGDQTFSGQISYEVREAKTFTLRATNEDKILEKSIEVIVIQTITPTVTLTSVPPDQKITHTPTITPIAVVPEIVTITDFDMIDMQTGWAEGGVPGGAASLLRTIDGGKTWQDVTPPEGYPAGSRFFALDGQRAWVVPNGFGGGMAAVGGVVWSTFDGGLTWQGPWAIVPNMTIVPDFSPQALYFLDQVHGWLVVRVDHAMSQDELVIMATKDGGVIWEQIADKDSMSQNSEGVAMAANMPCHVSGIAFSDPNYGYMAGDCLGVGNYGFTVLSTLDGGRTWMAVFTNPTKLPQELQAAMNEGQVICGSTGVEYNTAGFLVQHTCLPFIQGRYYYNSLLPRGSNAWLGWAGETASFATADVGYSLGQLQDEDGKRTLSVTTDGGKSWTVGKTNITWQAARLDFVAPGQGFALAWKLNDGQPVDHTLVRTEDGGESWTLVEGVLK